MAFPVDLLKNCWFLAGPTACGKTATSLLLAKRINAEIIALDSMTVYRGMDVGTAKVTPEERASIPHHLIDVLDPEDEFSLADYLSAAEPICREVIGRSRIPLFVGGTGLYLKAIMRGVFEGPAADWTLRQRLESEAMREGPTSLHNQLRLVDPSTAARLHPNDQRRIIRAIEVFELSGTPMSEWQQQGPRPIDQRPRMVVWLSPPRDWLYEQIDRRVERMFANGLLDEIQKLRCRPKPLSHTARQALGYKEVLDWLEEGSLMNLSSQEIARHSKFHELVTTIQTRTRQFAKRQHTWFRNLEECTAIEISGCESPTELVDRILRMRGSNG